MTEGKSTVQKIEKKNGLTVSQQMSQKLHGCQCEKSHDD